MTDAGIYLSGHGKGGIATNTANLVPSFNVATSRETKAIIRHVGLVDSGSLYKIMYTTGYIYKRNRLQS